MTKKEYADYESVVAEFFKREGIVNLTGGHVRCPKCDIEWSLEKDVCPKCGGDRDLVDEPYFSWRSCDCCKAPLGGDREHATGWNPTANEIREYEVCFDCIYYFGYGVLDDFITLGVEEDGKK